MKFKRIFYSALDIKIGDCSISETNNLRSWYRAQIKNFFWISLKCKNYKVQSREVARALFKAGSGVICLREWFVCVGSTKRSFHSFLRPIRSAGHVCGHVRFTASTGSTSSVRCILLATSLEEAPGQQNPAKSSIVYTLRWVSDPRLDIVFIADRTISNLNTDRRFNNGHELCQILCQWISRVVCNKISTVYSDYYI